MTSAAMFVLAVDGLVEISVAVFAVLGIGCVVLGRQQRGSNGGFLEWDPIARTHWRNDQESVDMVEMLALHNADQARNGLPTVTMEEYAEAARRPPERH